MAEALLTPRCLPFFICRLGEELALSGELHRFPRKVLFKRLAESVVVILHTVCIRQCKLAESFFRLARSAQIGSQDRGITGARMSFGQQLSADTPVFHQAVALELFRLD